MVVSLTLLLLLLLLVLVLLPLSPVLRSELTRWLAERAEGMGVEVYPGFAGKEVLYDWHGAVVGVATGDQEGGVGFFVQSVGGCWGMYSTSMALWWGW